MASKYDNGVNALGQRKTVATTGSVFAQDSGAWTFRYDPFGNLLPASTGSTTLFRHRFSTKPVDADTGLCYYGFRNYDPLAGRWPSRDPIGERGGVNLYGFVGNSSIIHIDRLGERPGYVDLPGDPHYTPPPPKEPQPPAPNPPPPPNNGADIPVPFIDRKLVDDPSGNAGTIPPLQNGTNINLWGSKEAKGFDDYEVAGCPDVERYREGRPLTSKIESRSVDRIMIRSSPFRECEMAEICRICKPGCTVTVTLAAAGADLREMNKTAQNGAGGRFDMFKNGAGDMPVGNGDTIRLVYLSFRLKAGECPSTKNCETDKK